MTNQIDNATFREQIKEDIALLQESLSWHKHITKDEYAFNYWILSNIYNLDPEDCHGYITEYNDKGIDCFVHYPESKELYIIQNKYYEENTALTRKDVTDFATSPIQYLEKGEYTRSEELQRIYDEAKKEGYNIYLHFYVSNDKRQPGFEQTMRDAKGVSDGIVSEGRLFYLSDIKDIFYGKSYRDDIELEAELRVENRGTYLRILPHEYGLPNMSKAFYVMTKVTDIYALWQKAKERDYPIFEQNIREYLGGTSLINKKIIQTLEDDEEKHNFFYYNNGITITCDDAEGDARRVKITNPQIINGCQTASSIAEALSRKNGNHNEYDNVYVMTKILVISKREENTELDHRKVVKYTNSQNSINEKAFGAARDIFFGTKKELEKRGFLLIVKQSDKHQLKGDYKDDASKWKLLDLANKRATESFYAPKDSGNPSSEHIPLFGKLTDVFVSLETLLQVIMAYQMDAYHAYTKKSRLLKPTDKEYYQDFSMKINDLLTPDAMVKLIVMHKRAEHYKKASDSNQASSPFYLFNFLGYYLEEKGIDKLDFIKGATMEDLSVVYQNFAKMPSKYMEKMGGNYNYLIKSQVDKKVMGEIVQNHLDALKDIDSVKYERFNGVFEGIKKSGG